MKWVWVIKEFYDTLVGLLVDRVSDLLYYLFGLHLRMKLIDILVSKSKREKILVWRPSQLWWIHHK